MDRKTPRRKKDPFDPAPGQIIDAEAIRKPDDSRFTAAMDDVVKDAEAMRLRHMKIHRQRGFIFTSFGLLLALVGAVAFGWFFFVEINPLKAALCMVPGFLIPLMLHDWMERALKQYTRDYKRIFMPRMADALGGFKFNADHGIPRDIIGKTGVIPAHSVYKAEDCFLGMHKGVKVMFSEARLYKNGAHEPVFQGLFVLLETPHRVFEGHTIITADRTMAKRSAPKRWAALRPVDIKVENKSWDRFLVYSDKPEAATLVAGEKLLKELAEAADIFDKAELTAVMFRGQYVFMMIPNKTNMFEASSLFVPVKTKRHAVKCRKEIEKILEIIDVFEVYKGGAVTTPSHS